MTLIYFTYNHVFQKFQLTDSQFSITLELVTFDPITVECYLTLTEIINFILNYLAIDNSLHKFITDTINVALLSPTNY